jgi:hypothetical protein
MYLGNYDFTHSQFPLSPPIPLGRTDGDKGLTGEWVETL